MQSFVKIGEKNFLDIFGPLLDHCAAKKKFSPILTKFCMVIVNCMVIKIIKKFFQNFHFSDHFLTVCANAHCDGKNFVAKFITYKNNDMVRITVPSPWALKSWFLVVKLKMGCGSSGPRGA